MDNRLPNCFIVGAAKSGTTTLADLLNQNPQVYLPFAKEPRFFSNDEFFSNGFDWFRDTYYSSVQGQPVRLDASTPYLYWSEKVAPRLSTYDQDRKIKIIALFRNPVQRAYSMYWHLARDDRVALPFEEAIAAEEALLKEKWDSLYARGGQEHGLFRGGCYATLIQPFLDLFPRERILLLLHEDIISDFEVTMIKISNFLEIDPVNHTLIKSNPAAAPRNQKLQNFLSRPSGLPQKFLKLFTRFMPYEVRYRLKKKVIGANLQPVKYPPMSSELNAALRARYMPEIQQLETIMNRDLSQWYI
jgi:hypothetical protein